MNSKVARQLEDKFTQKTNHKSKTFQVEEIDKRRKGLPTAFIAWFYVFAVLASLCFYLILRVRFKIGDKKKKISDNRKLFYISKRASFWGTVFLAPVLLILLLTDFSYGIIQSNAVERNTIVDKLDRQLSLKPYQSISFVKQDGQTGYLRESLIKLDTEKSMVGGANEFVAFDHSSDDFVVYCFGSSSLMMPDPKRSFPYFMEKKAQESNRNLRVYNMGMSGIDSWSIRQRTMESLKYKPDLLAVYCGHNDQTYAYRIVSLEYSILNKDTLLDSTIRLYLENLSSFRSSLDGSNYFYFHALTEYVDPKLLILLNVLGVLKIDFDIYLDIQDKINSYLANNILAIADMAKEKGIPLVIITPIGNLESEPQSFDNKGTEYLNAGLKEADYHKRLSLLIKARDSDIFNIHVRAKSKLVDTIRGLASVENGIYVYNLESELMKEEFGFGNESFMDWIHFNPQTHEMIGSHITEYLLSQKLIECKSQTNKEK